MSSEQKMARYSMKSDYSGDHNPIRWDTEEFNKGLIYRNGIITIDEPGYYRITAAIQMHDYWDSRAYSTSIHTIVNGVTFLRGSSTWGAIGISTGIKYLRLYDTVAFRKESPESTRYGSQSNYFQIEKL